MTTPNEMLWNHSIENEDWVEAARLQELAQSMGELGARASELSEPTVAVIASTSESE